MGFRQIKLFEFSGGPNDPGVLRVSLRNGSTLYVSPSYDNHPAPTPYVIKPEHMPAWMREKYAEALAHCAQANPDWADRMPRDYTEAKGHWAVSLSNRLSADLPFVIHYGQTRIQQVFGADSIINMMPASATDALIDARASQSAHS